MGDYIFVYGTLRREIDHPAHQLLSRGAEWIGEATFQGKLYDLVTIQAPFPQNSFPTPSEARSMP